ncbi:MAG: sensor histidine kinase [Gammaproteobacteria bacterium]|jgi:two-component system sensor histidine kinase AlgZ|nr:sensor histidine kinase [Gammaproteobacteria bacterium]
MATSPPPHAQRGPASKAAPAAHAPALLPDFCSLPMTLGVVLYGELLAMLLALASSSPLAGFWARLGPLSLLVLGIVMLGASLLCILRIPLRRMPGPAAVATALAVIVASAVAVAWLCTILVPWAEAAGLLPDDGARGLLIRAGLISAIVGALMLRYLYLHQQWRSQVEAVANARLKTLQARIRPHFLFNSMNTIASLTQTDPRLAEEVVEDLADLFRASLATDADRTTLAEELALSRRYLNIEAQRLGERLQVIWDLEDLPGDAAVPPLILQPLVENAVYHGIQPSSQPGVIRIVGRYRRGAVSLSIRNTLPRSADAARRHRGNGMALQNVSQRMEAMFPGTARVTRSLVDGDYLVRLVFPYPWRQS